MRRAALLSVFIPFIAQAQMSPPSMPAHPDISQGNICFSSEGDIWYAPIDSGRAVRLTSFPGREDWPHFSPDGTQIAFTADYEGKPDIYVLSVGGGIPKRLTLDATTAGPEVLGWTPDGGSVVFRSTRGMPFGVFRIWTQPVFGGMPSVMPLHAAGSWSFSPDGSKAAYTNLEEHTNNWRRYHGGMQNDIMLADRKANKFTQLTTSEFDEVSPVWFNGQILFLSEKDGVGNVYSVDPNTKKETKLTNFTAEGAKAINTDGKQVVVRVGDHLELLDPGKKSSTPLKITLTSDRIHAVPHAVRAGISEYAIGPSGKRALITYRGQVWSAPAANGDLRPVFPKMGVRDQHPAWSPDGKTISFVSDRDDEWNIWTVPSGLETEPTQLTHFKNKPIPGYAWSPNSKYLVVLDESGALHKIDAETSADTVIFQAVHDQISSLDISGTGRLIAFVYSDGFNSSSVYIYDTTNSKLTRLSERPHVDSACTFDKTGRYLYFYGQRSVELNWDPFDFQLDAGSEGLVGMYLLTANAENPLIDKPDEEAAGEKKEDEDLTFTYDIEGAKNRMVFLPGMKGEFGELAGGKEGLYFNEGGTLKLFSLKSKKIMTIAEGVGSYQLNAKGDKIAVRRGGLLTLDDAGGPVNADPINLGGWTVQIDPKAEWRQILREGWRFIRDNFYDPKLHGADWPALWTRLEKRLESVGDRSELNELIGDMQAEVNVSHMFNGGGDTFITYPTAPAGNGLLGCDWTFEDGVLKVTHVLKGDGFENSLGSPLAQAGVDIRDGDYIFSINGQKPTPGQDPQLLLAGTSGRTIRIETSHERSLSGIRTVYVKPVGNDRNMRYIDWVQKETKMTSDLSGGKFAYVHVPNMGNDGMAQLTKSFYANLDKDGLVLDVRDNSGGITSGMVLERLRRIVFEYDQGRYFDPLPYHRMAFLSKVVVICNEGTASDGEYFCTGFRAMKLGPVVGTRTWGGFVAVGGFGTIDGGNMSCPVQGSFAPDGDWLPDGTGFKPDITVVQDPVLTAQGRDPQLEKAVEVLKELVRKDPPKWPVRRIPPKKG